MNLCDLVSYHEDLRASFFLSSMTLATFLFSMKSFIVQTLKKEVYDTDEYQERVSLVLADIEGTRRHEAGYDSYYGGLKRFTVLLSAAIYTALFGAVLQISIGYIGEWWSAAICILVTFFGWLLFLSSMVAVSRNISDMITIAENAATKRFSHSKDTDEEES